LHFDSNSLILPNTASENNRLIVADFFNRAYIAGLHLTTLNQMKKTFFSAALAFGVSLSAMAVPAKPGHRTITQPDGTTITVALVGDERFHTFITSDGLPVAKDAEGNFAYIDPTTGLLSGIKAHNPGARTPAEADFLKANAGNLSVAKLAARAAARRTAKAKPANTPAKAASQVPTTGSARVPILLVAYKDVDFRDGAKANDTFQDFFSTGAKSARQYFIDQSNGKYTPQFDVYGPITLSGNRATYGGNDFSGNDKGVGKMVAEACKGLNTQINFKDYDNNGDGECDVVIVLYAGVGEASADVANAVWPMQWDLASSDYGSTINLDGVTISKFALFNELNGSNTSQIDGVGTFCHEFSHCLGLPDFYDTRYNGHFGMSCWSLMDQGSYNDDGYTPIGYSAYEKDFMGWIDIEEATENTRYTLPVFNQKDAATDRAVKITNDHDRNEYYIIENRALQGWDAYMPTEGLMISHVTYSASAWNNNVVNNYDLQRMTLIPADNQLKLNSYSYMGDRYYEADPTSLLGDLWPYGNANELTDTSIPAAKVNTGGVMSKPITEIKINPDGTGSFWFMKGAYETMATPVLNAASGVTATGFTASWEHTPQADGTTYTLEVTTHRDIAYEKVLEEPFDTENNGWETEGYIDYKTTGQVRFGSSANTGAIISPSFQSTDEGLVTVVINAKAWSATENAGAKISVINATGRVIDTETVMLTEDFADYTVVLDAAPAAANRVRIETIGTKKRFYVEHAIIYTGDASTAAPAKAPAETGDATKRTVTGIDGQSYTVTGLNAGTAYDFRVKAIPAADAEWHESEWSAKQTVTLGVNGGITTIEADLSQPVEYFTLEGIRINADNLTPGIYIRRQGSNVEKIMVK